MKLSKIVDSRFQNTLNKLSSEVLPIKVAYKLKGISKRAKEEFVKYEELRKDALNRYGNKRNDGSIETDERGNVQFDEANIRAFVDDMNELMSEDVSIGGPLKLSDLGDNVRLSADDIAALDDLLIE